jgi:hypothetical protein
MPVAPTNTPTGAASVANAQALHSRVIIVRAADPSTTYEFFAPTVPAAPEFVARNALVSSMLSLGRVHLMAFLFPEYTEEGTTYRARNSLQWRAVSRLPGGGWDDLAGVATTQFLPVSTPSLLLPGVPVYIPIYPGGTGDLSVEIRVDHTISTEADQGIDQVVFALVGSG